MKNQLVRFFSENRKYWWWPVLFLCIASAAGLIQIGLAYTGGRIVDAGLTGQFASVPSLVWTLLLLLVLEVLRSYLNCIINANATESMFVEVRMRLMDRLMHADMGRFEKRFRTGDMLSRVNSDVIGLCELFAGQFTWLLRVAITAIIALFYCIFLSWPLALVYLIVTPLSMYLVQRINPSMHESNIY